ncbi:5-formyltetrahydrofolate cyclo-ligase [Legionella impletisoli]|uniref:5-formyltetrahydrofolate cyclo-ligase n=1 Tax=Legionella impletisoli TaxID=343510 RepID=A0A917JY68_9GAMM|nr:5-formyltetrahydrofolate cyclo-ligase [Legionella impletisoli]GGI89978.1 5-formyltetrahydrofolate cyclo-ligase [Legionella impletisoli]
MSNQSKVLLRKKLKQIRNALSQEEQMQQSHRICSHIKNLEPFKFAKKIALYSALPGEVNLDELWQIALHQDKICYFPVLQPDLTLAFLPVDTNTEWTKNRFNINEPVVDLVHEVKPENLDIIFMPLLGFDEQGTRLGMGAGYYDRTLSNHIFPLLAGVAFEVQKLDYIKPDTWDIPMAVTITERAIYWSKS